MTLPGPDLPTMKQDMSALIIDWGVSCSIRRLGTGRTSAGQVSVLFSSVATETLWIQPIAGMKRSFVGRVDPGIIDKTTHVIFERYSGYAMQVEDEILPAGESYVYDVLSSATIQTHRYLFAQQVKRS